VIETLDGRSFSGALLFENPDLLLLQSFDGTTIRVAMRDVTGRHRGASSIMPPELLEGVSTQGLADLHAFLSGL
jgi:hypothetical protein